MGTKVIGKLLPMKIVYDTDEFILLGIMDNIVYENGQRTSKTDGFKYEVVDPISFDKFTVKIKGQEQPLMAPEELTERRQNGEKVLVEFINGVDRLYTRKNGTSFTVEDSFSADDILLVTE